MNQNNQLPPMAQKLNMLFSKIRKADNTEYNPREVEAGIKQMVAENEEMATVTAGYIWQIRHGYIKSPGVEKLSAICAFFGVDLDFFVEDASADVPEEQFLVRQLSQDTLAREIAFRAMELDGPDKEMIIEMMKSIKKVKEARAKQDT